MYNVENEIKSYLDNQPECKGDPLDGYIEMCLQSAKEAYELLCDQGHSGMSINITKYFLNSFMDHIPLTPVTDENANWEKCSVVIDKHQYQSKRYPSLFKTIERDGSVKYTCSDYVTSEDIHKTRWHCGLASDYIYNRFPITLPFSPMEPYVVYTDDFLYGNPGAVGSYDTKALLYFTYPDGTKEEINKYYKEDGDYGWKEITKEEYEERKAYREEK